MRIKFPYLMALARRMAPGVFEDPERVIGDCLYCDLAVTYAAGDLRRDGRARHDECERLANRAARNAMGSKMLFFHALALLRDLPAVKPHLLDAVRAMPDRFGPRHMVEVLDEMLPLVEIDGTFGLARRREIILAVRGVKRDLIGLSSTA